MIKASFLTGAAALVLGLSSPVIAADYRASMTAAEAAFTAEDWPALRDALDAAQEARPYSLFVYRNRVLAYWLAGDKDAALALAAKAAERGLALSFTGHPAFEEMKAAPGFVAITARMQENLTPVGAASAAVAFAETELLPEAIAIAKGKTYIGSVRTGKILRADQDSEELTLIATAQGGVFDLELRGDAIWAAVNNQLAYEDADPEDAFAAVMVFDASDGQLRRDVRVGEPGALIGDLEVAKDGTAYASDSLTPRLFRVAPEGDAFEVFADDPRFANLQGIALDERNHRIFAADYLTGLFVIDTQTGAVTALANDADAHLGGIDGLYYYKGALIGVQNGTSPHRIAYIGLNNDATAVTTFTAMQSNLDEWNEPTHGDVAGKAFVYIATSNWPAYGDDGGVREGAELAPLRLMTLPLETK